MAKKILVAEDNQQMRNLIVMRLEINGFKVTAAANGEEALEKTKSENPDLIIMDLMMPKINGFEVCRMLKFDEKFKKIPIIILTALDQKSDRDKATECGANAYLLKPFDLEQLLKEIKRLSP